MKTIPLQVAVISLAPLFLAGCAGTLTPSHQDAAKYTRFDAAVEKCDLGEVEALINRDPALVNEQGWGGTTPLELAALNNCTELATFLIGKGADVNVKAEGGVTPLHLAAQKGNVTLVEALLLRKADPTAVDDQGRTPEARALQWGHTETANFLKSYTLSR